MLQKACTPVTLLSHNTAICVLVTGFEYVFQREDSRWQELGLFLCIYTGPRASTMMVSGWRSICYQPVPASLVPGSLGRNDEAPNGTTSLLSDGSHSRYCLGGWNMAIPVRMLVAILIQAVFVNKT